MLVKLRTALSYKIHPLEVRVLVRFAVTPVCSRLVTLPPKGRALPAHAWKLLNI